MCRAARFFCNQGKDVDQAFDRANLCMAVLAFAEALDQEDPCAASLDAQESIAKMEPPPTFPEGVAALLNKNTDLAAQAQARIQAGPLVHGGEATGKQKRARGQGGDKDTKPKRKAKAKAEPKEKAKAKAKGKAKAGVKRGRSPAG